MRFASPRNGLGFALPLVLACVLLTSLLTERAGAGTQEPEGAIAAPDNGGAPTLPGVTNGHDVAGLVDIGQGRRMYLACRGSGSPTVVLVSGLRGSAEAWDFAGKSGRTVWGELPALTRVCAYDRPGTPVGDQPGRSDPVQQPTTAGDAVADLQALLKAAHEAGPYVLVGHSYGGLIVRLYASLHPEDVSGLVLVDAMSEGIRDVESPEQWARQRAWLVGDIQESLAVHPELETIDPDLCFDEIRAAPPLPQLPLLVLSSDRVRGPEFPALIAAGRLPPDTPPDFGYVLDAAHKQAQQRLGELVFGAKLIAHTDSGHGIQVDQPQLVIDSIRDVVDTVRRRDAGGL